MSSNHSKDVKVLIRAARKAGCEIGMNGQGHVTFRLPGQPEVQASLRPGSAKAVSSLRSRLRGIGVPL